MVQAKKRVYPVKQCGMCRKGKMKYSRFRKSYKCDNPSCGYEEPKANISDLEREE